MDRVTEALKWVVEINSDYPAMIEIDKVDAKSHLDELAALRAENERLRDALHHKDRALKFIANNPRIDDCVHMVLKQAAKEALK